MSAGRPEQSAGPPGNSATRAALLASLIKQRRLDTAVPAVLDILEGEDPLATAGRFTGDLLRGLMEIPGHFWGRQPHLYERYRAALRAGAAARRLLPPEQRLQFWKPLVPPVGRREPAPDTEDE